MAAPSGIFVAHVLNWAHRGGRRPDRTPCGRGVAEDVHRAGAQWHGGEVGGRRAGVASSGARGRTSRHSTRPRWLTAYCLRSRVSTSDGDRPRSGSRRTTAPRPRSPHLWPVPPTTPPERTHPISGPTCHRRPPRRCRPRFSPPTRRPTSTASASTGLSWRYSRRWRASTGCSRRLVPDDASEHAVQLSTRTERTPGGPGVADVHGPDVRADRDSPAHEGHRLAHRRTRALPAGSASCACAARPLVPAD